MVIHTTRKVLVKLGANLPCIAKVPWAYVATRQASCAWQAAATVLDIHLKILSCLDQGGCVWMLTANKW